MPPTTQSAISAKSDVITATWNPRLVNTPVPTMLATTRFVAVTAEIFFSIVSGLVLEQALVSRGAADLSTQIAGLFSLWAHLRFVKILLAYFSFSWKKELHVVAGDLSGTNDIAGSTRMVAWVDRGA